MAPFHEHASLSSVRPRSGVRCAGIAAQARHKPSCAPLDQIGTVGRFERDVMLFVADDTSDFYARLLSGVLRIATSNRVGRRRIVAFLYAGDRLSTRWLRNEAWTVEAVTSGTLTSCPLTLLDQIVEDQPDGARDLLMAAERVLLEILQERSLVVQRYAAERMAGFLLRLADRLGEWSADGVAAVDLPMSRSDMADYLALTVETVSRELTRLRRDGLIALPHARRLVVLRPQALRRVIDEGVEELDVDYSGCRDARFARVG